MTEKFLHVDVNVFLPASLRAQAALRAAELTPANLPKPVPPTAPPEAHELAVLRNKKWPNGHTLRIRFLEGNPTVQQRLIEFANQWTQYANLHFDFGNHAEAEIRISFNPQLGSWSRIGTEAVVYPQDVATMNFGWLEPNSTDETCSAVVLHEFGHAIGCIHEHQTPKVGIQWNKPVVYAYYAQMGWSKDDVDYNLFYAFDHDSTNQIDQAAQFDDQSIMIYPIPKEHTLDGYAVPWRTQLSATDKQFIAQVYPKG